jgi:hypothetical protein
VKIEKITYTANPILNRIKGLLGIETDSQLADNIKVKPNVISAWRKRNTIAFELIIYLCEINNWDLNYIILGRNPSDIYNNTPKKAEIINFESFSKILQKAAREFNVMGTLSTGDQKVLQLTEEEKKKFNK